MVRGNLTLEVARLIYSVFDLKRRQANYENKRYLALVMIYIKIKKWKRKVEGTGGFGKILGNW
jgi:hypothetical protein